MIAYDGRELSLQNGMKANTSLFLEKRKIYQWMVSPFYDMKQSASGPVELTTENPLAGIIGETQKLAAQAEIPSPDHTEDTTPAVNSLGAFGKTGADTP